jgi:hypothetical protein
MRQLTGRLPDVPAIFRFPADDGPLPGFDAEVDRVVVLAEPSAG